METSGINDRQSFIQFLHELRNNFLQDGERWENKTLDQFLEALAAYAEDIQGYYDNMMPSVNADVPSWRVFADMLMGASMYE
ncbi:MAG: hypothetical protein DI535_23500 [Citrobacter freundii]|nr:MAG: hypothetical protein DI535_23500 [Citrobacter freundii]